MNLAQLRIGLAIVGMLVAVAGVLLASQRIVWIAIGILTASMVLRFMTRRSPSSGDSPS